MSKALKYNLTEVCPDEKVNPINDPKPSSPPNPGTEPEID